MIIIIGITERDSATGCDSIVHGYRDDVRQIYRTVTLEGDGSGLTASQWVEAVVTATDHVGEAPTGVARAIQLALREQVPYSSRLKIGDTVTVLGETWACGASGWWQVPYFVARPADPRRGL